MRVQSIREFNGPNIHHYAPVLAATLDFSPPLKADSDSVIAFVGRLRGALPNLELPGSVLENIPSQASMARVVEHVVMTLAEKTAIDLRSSTPIDARFDETAVIVPFRNKRGAKLLLETAVALVDALILGQRFPLEQKLAEFKNELGGSGYSFNSLLLIQSAEARGIPCIPLPHANLIQLGFGRHRRLIHSSRTDQTSLIGGDLVSNKNTAKKILRNALIPVPEGEIVTTEREALDAFRDLHAEVVVKPLDGSQGKGISIGLKSEQEIISAFRVAREHSARVLIEECLRGRDHRVLIVGGMFVAACERIPAHVIADGKHSIAGLVEMENQNPLRGEGHAFPLSKIRVDDQTRRVLGRLGLDVTDIPKEGTTIFLREAANGSLGGYPVDVTDSVHPEIRSLCERAARVFGLDVCGVDLIVKDISKPIASENPGGVIEINTRPGLHPHLTRRNGEKRNPAGVIIDMLFPPGAECRIPIIAIAGKEAGATAAAIIRQGLARSGKTIGANLSDSIFIGNDRISKIDASPDSDSLVLCDPAVEIALFEISREQVLDRGLPYDWSDVTALIDLTDDSVNNLLAQRVREGGTLIINADNPELRPLLDSTSLSRIPKKTILLSEDPNNPRIQRQLRSGQRAYFYYDHSLVESEAGSSKRICELTTTSSMKPHALMTAIAVNRASGYWPARCT